VRNRVLFNDESYYNVWCKAVVASKQDVQHCVQDDLVHSN